MPQSHDGELSGNTTAPSTEGEAKEMVEDEVKEPTVVKGPAPTDVNKLNADHGQEFVIVNRPGAHWQFPEGTKGKWLINQRWWSTKSILRPKSNRNPEVLFKVGSYIVPAPGKPKTVDGLPVLLLDIQVDERENTMDNRKDYFVVYVIVNEPSKVHQGPLAHWVPATQEYARRRGCYENTRSRIDKRNSRTQPPS